MNKETYLHELGNQLRISHIQEQDDIIAEYEEHFRLKLADGYSEEEIAARLGNPKDIASQFALNSQPAASIKATKLIIGIGLGFADIFVFSLFILLFAWVICFAAFSLSSLCLGGILIIRYDISAFIPYLPYPGAIVMGISLLALSILSAIGTIYCYLFVIQLIRAYLHWHKRTLAVNEPVRPPLPKHPLINDKMRRTFRSLTLISVAVFAVSFIGGMFMLFIYADFRPFWHVWHWFGGGYAS